MLLVRRRNVGYIGGLKFDPEDFLEDDLIRDGRRPIGNIYIDRWDLNGEFYQGGCFLYYEGETMKGLLRQERGTVSGEGDPGRGYRDVRHQN